MEQIQHDLELLSRVYTCTARFSLFRNNMSEIAACGISAYAVVMFSNKNNVSRQYRSKLCKKIGKRREFLNSIQESLNELQRKSDVLQCLKNYIKVSYVFSDIFEKFF